MGAISIWHWLIVLLIVVLVFGTKKLSNMGSDLGKAVKGFKDGVRGDDDHPERPGELPSQAATEKNTIDVDTREQHKL